VEGSCEHCTEPSGSIKFVGNFSTIACVAVSQEELISMELLRITGFVHHLEF
jgi:hypothetical protein